MHAVNIRELKNNPSAALRSAREDDLVVVMNRDEPQALLVDLGQLGLPDIAGVKTALAVALFKQGNVSLGYAARVAGKSLSEMMVLLASMGIPAVTVSARDVEHDLGALEKWKRRTGT